MDAGQERELIDRVLAGDERAFSEFFDAYFPRLYRFAFPRLARDVETTREVVLTTVGKVMRSLPLYRGESALFTWMCQICRCDISDRVELQRRDAKRMLLADDTPELRAAFDAVEAPEEVGPATRYARGQTLQLIHVVLDRLPHRYGDVLEWKYLEDRSVEEIGIRLGIGRTAAQSILARARVAFRDSVETVFGIDAHDLLAGSAP